MFGKVDSWMEGGRDVQMSEIQKRFIKNRKMGLESGQRIPLPALSLFFDPIGERAENNRQNWQMKMVNDSIPHSISQHNCLRLTLSYIFRRGTGCFPFALPDQILTHLHPTWYPMRLTCMGNIKGFIEYCAKTLCGTLPHLPGFPPPPALKHIFSECSFVPLSKRK